MIKVKVYFISKKSCPILYGNLLPKMGQGFLYIYYLILYVQEKSRYKWTRLLWYTVLLWKKRKSPHLDRKIVSQEGRGVWMNCNIALTFHLGGNLRTAFSWYISILDEWSTWHCCLWLMLVLSLTLLQIFILCHA